MCYEDAKKSLANSTSPATASHEEFSNPICYKDAKKSLAKPTSSATASPEELSNNPPNVLVSALQSPTTVQSE